MSEQVAIEQPFPQIPIVEEAGVDQRAMADLLAMMVRLKFIVPFLVLLTLKLIVDNFIPSLIIISTIYSIIRIKGGLEMQLSLKKRSSVFILVNLLLLSFVILFVSSQCSRVFKMPDNLGRRLIMSYGLEKKPPMSFLNTMWCCLIVDGIVETGILSLQIISCLVIGSKTLRCGDIKKMFSMERLRNNFTRHSNHRTHNHASPATQLASNSFDLETGENNGSLPRPPSSASLYSQLVTQSGTSLSTILGLARRPSNNITGLHHSVVHTTSSSGSNIPHVSPYNTINDHHNTVNDDDSETDIEQEASEYLRRLRLCSLLDMVGLVYRSFLPLPLWLLYFKGDGLGSSVLPSVYVGVKLMDLSWKVRGMSEAVVLYFSQTLEFGHYSTPDEVTSSSSNGVPHDCPVCFDCPKTPVSLDCKHIFCEMCIAEWVDKEKTCPVCRAEVKGASPLVSAMREECVHYTPIFT